MKFPNLLPKWTAEERVILKAVAGLGAVMMLMVILAAPDHGETTCSCRCREVVREEAAVRLRQALEAWEREPAAAAERAREAERIRRMAEQIRRERTEVIKAGAAVRAGGGATEEGDAVAEPAAEVDR